MPRKSRYIILEGQYEEQVLGTFKIIRGFADLRDIAAVSVSYKMTEPDENGIVKGHQRQLDEKHAKDIQRYLEKSDTRFIPEVILSVRTDLEDETDGINKLGVFSLGTNGIKIKRRWKSKHVQVHRIKISRNRLDEIKNNSLIRRIDGNHRLAKAVELAEEEHSPRKYIAPFCVILFDPPGNDADDYAESKIFHTINSKAEHLESEHALKLLLGQSQDNSMTAQQEFDYDPALYLTRLLQDKINNLADEHKQRIGDCPLTSLNSTAEALIKQNDTLKENRNNANTFANDIFAAITEFLTRLWSSHPQLCKAEYFLELAACVWNKAVGENNIQKINNAVEYLQDLGNWLGEEGFISIKSKDSFAQQLLKVYESIRNKIPKRIFLARWYPNQEHNGEAFRKANLRLEQIRETLNKVKDEHNIELELIDLGTEEGGTFSIHRAVYDSIDFSDIIIIDLTGHRPNVCVEAGYALKHYNKERMIFVFQSSQDDPNVAFDLNTYRYEPVSEAAEIPGKVKPHIEAILRKSGANI